MISWASAGTAVILLGIVLASPAVVFIGGAVILVRVLGEVWPRRTLEALEYERQLFSAETVVGEPVELRLSLWNPTRLPVAWASARDTLAAELRAEGATSAAGTTQELRVAATLRPFERVTGRFVVRPLRRGVHEVGPAWLRVAELFGTHAPGREAGVPPLAIVARPLSAPVTGPLPSQATLARQRARRSLFTDPSLYAGVRPFQPGDPLRSIHWRASARQDLRGGAYQAKRFEPSVSGQAILVFDVQTLEGEYWMLVWDERLFEDLVVATLSLARQLIGQDLACGFAAANYVGPRQRYLFLPARADRAQVGRLADTLARISPEGSAPLAQLLTWLPHRVPAGTMITVLSARDPLPSAPIVRRLGQSGYPVHFLLFGGAQQAREARRASISARSARVEWEGGRPHAVSVAN